MPLTGGIELEITFPYGDGEVLAEESRLGIERDSLAVIFSTVVATWFLTTAPLNRVIPVEAKCFQRTLDRFVARRECS